MYFFFWVVTLLFPYALASASKNHSWVLAADFTGLGFFGNEINLVTGAHSFTIGYAPYNAALSPVLFSGLAWLPRLYLPRLGSVLFTIPFFLIAWAAFQRFDPAKRSSPVKATAGKITHLWQSIVSFWGRFTSPRGGWVAGPPSFVKAITLDVRLTFALYPIFFVLLVSSIFFSLWVPLSVIRTSILPLIFLILVPLLASISTRDRQRNTAALIFSAPFVRERITVLKFFSALFSTLLIGCIPLVRMGLHDPFSAAAAFNAMLFMVSAATLLGFSASSLKCNNYSFFIEFLWCYIPQSFPGFGVEFIGDPGTFVHALSYW